MSRLSWGMPRKFYYQCVTGVTSCFIRVVLDQLIVEACADVKSSEMVYLNLECVLYRANMDARNGVIAGDLHLENTKFEGL